MVAYLQHVDQHRRQLLPARGARRFQQQVARCLQLVGQGCLLLHQLANQRGVGGRVEAVGLGAHQAAQRQHGLGQHLRPVATVEQDVGERGKDQVAQRAHGEIQAGGQQAAAVQVLRHGHGEGHGEHDRDDDRQAALAPGAGEEGEEGGRYQQQAEIQWLVMQRLNAGEQRQAEQRRRQQAEELAAARHGMVRRYADDGADRRHRGGELTQQQVGTAGDQHQSEAGGHPGGDVGTQ